MTRRGFSLVEILVTLTIIAALAVIGTRLMGTSVRSIHDAITAREAILHYEAALATLRSDVLHATRLSSAGNDQLNIGTRIVWRADATGTQRMEGSDVQRWSEVHLHFRANDTGVEIRPGSSLDNQAIELVSADRWLNRVAP